MPGKSPHSPAGVGSQSGVGGEPSGRAACLAGVSAHSCAAGVGGEYSGMDARLAGVSVPSGAGGGERLAGVPKLI